VTPPDVWAQHEANHSIDGARRAHDKAVAADTVAYEARLPAREANVTARVAGTSPDPAQQARRALLYYLATGTPAPHPGMPNQADIPLHDLINILRGLMPGGFLGARWDTVTTYAEQLRQVLADGGVGTTAEAFTEELLLDAINSAAPNREA